jgi:LuxR family transcriptional regulator, maltose regulon positive regulatory protein
METGMIKAVMGKCDETRTLYERALAIWRQAGDLSWQATLLNNLGSLHQQQGEYEQAVQVFDEGLLCAERSGNKRMQGLISLSLGDLYTEVEDFEIAEKNYQRATDLIQRLGELFLINYLALAETNKALLKNETGKARRILDRLSPHIKMSDSAYEYGLYQLVYGRVLLQSGKFKQARSSFLAAKRCFTQDGREMESVWGHIWLAAAYYQNGEPALAQKELDLVLKRPNQVNHYTIVAIRQAKHWLEGLQASPNAKSILLNVFEKADQLNTKLPRLRRQLRQLSRTVEVPNARLVIHAFGPAQVWVNGTLIRRSNWQTKSVRDLFFYLLTVDRPATKEQIAELLWPDTLGPARLRLRFKNEIYRLRRAIGQETILFEDNHYQFNSLVDHEYDVEAFEVYLAKANYASTSAEKIELYQKATELVHGLYLEDIGDTWAWPERERLSQKFLSVCLSLAKLYLREAQVPRALIMCQRAIEYDETFEAAYRLSMQIYHRNGDLASVIHTFHALEQVMKKDFDLTPSVESQNLYRELIP